MSKPFTYVPQPAKPSKYQPSQRYFTDGDTRGSRGEIDCSLSVFGTHVMVFRYAEYDFARLSIQLRSHGAIHADLTAQELRDLAMKCLDAAQDLDDFTAAQLAGPGVPA